MGQKQITTIWWTHRNETSSNKKAEIYVLPLSKWWRQARAANVLQQQKWTLRHSKHHQSLFTALVSSVWGGGVRSGSSVFVFVLAHTAIHLSHFNLALSGFLSHALGFCFNLMSPLTGSSTHIKWGFDPSQYGSSICFGFSFWALVGLILSRFWSSLCFYGVSHFESWFISVVLYHTLSEVLLLTQRFFLMLLFLILTICSSQRFLLLLSWYFSFWILVPLSGSSICSCFSWFVSDVLTSAFIVFLI